jgi:hypothetical protein
VAIPESFRSKSTLQTLSQLSVGTSLAAATALSLSQLLHGMGGARGLLGLIVAVPTLLVGMLWVRVLRWPKTVGQTGLRLGWLLSPVLAALNAGLACAMMLAVERPSGSLTDLLLRLFGGFVLGMTFGAIVWVPALMATLVAFGAPLAWAQGLAKKGLAGQERGDGIIGVVCGLIALATLAAPALLNVGPGLADALPLIRALGLTATGLSAATVFSAWSRAEERERFVAAVERGEVEQFRVDATDEGKVLVRVVTQGQGYRVADYEEEIAALDKDGAVTRGVRVEPA